MYTEPATADAGLAADEVALFRENGYLGPCAHPLLRPGAPLIELLIERFEALESTTAMPARPDVYRERLIEGKRWWRGMQLEIPEVWAVARHPYLLSRLRAILGDNIVFGAAFLAKLMPGERHGFHFDSEFHHADGVAVFFGMKNVNADAAVTVISRSHALRVQPSAFLTDGVRGRLDGGRLSESDAVLQAARSQDARAELVQPDLGVGDFMIGDGHLWHGVFNRSDAPRYGMVMFFAPPATRFRIVVAGDEEPEFFPREVNCSVLCGSGDGAANHLVDPPAGVEEAMARYR